MSAHEQEIVISLRGDEIQWQSVQQELLQLFALTLLDASIPGILLVGLTDPNDSRQVLIQKINDHFQGQVMAEANLEYGLG